MIVGPDFVNSISENNIDISSAWIFTDVDAYSYDYKEVMLQPISSEAVSLTYLKFKVPVTNIEIRSGNTSTSPLLFAGISFNIEENSGSVVLYHNDLGGLQGGAVGEYYHLSATQYNLLTSGGDTTLHSHSFDRNRSNHTGTQLASTIFDFTSASRMLLSATTPIVYSSATGIFSHSTTGTAGTYTKVVTNATGHVTSGSVLTSADIPSLDASKITTGTIDVARIPVLPSQVPQVTTNLASLTTAQQNIITSGTVVTTSDDGWRYVYSGTGSKTASASYVILADISPEWTAIANRPTNVSTWSNDAGYLTNASSLSWSKVIGTPTTLAGYGVVASDSLFASINAGTATKLQTARTIAGVSFDGSANISIPYVNLIGLPTLGTLAAKSTVTWTSDITGLPTSISNLGNASVHGGLKIGNITVGGWHGIEFSDPQTTRILINDVAGGNVVGFCDATNGWLMSFNRSKQLVDGWIPWARLQNVPSTFTPSAHSHAWSDITKPATISNFVDGAWAGASGYYGWSFTGASTRFGFSSNSGVVDVYADGNFYATDSGYLVYHTGNLTGDQSGHYHSSDRIWGNITSKPTTLSGFGITDGFSKGFLNGGSIDFNSINSSYPGGYVCFAPNGNAVSNAPNISVGGGAGFLLQGYGANSYWDTQLFLSSQSDTLQFRTSYDSSGTKTWRGWHTVWHDGNFTPGNYLPLAGGTMSGNLLGSTSYNIGASGNWWGNGYFDNLYAQNNLVWHAGNLIGNITGHYHASDRMWGNISGVPANVQNPQNYYLPLSGGTLTDVIYSTAPWSSTTGQIRIGSKNASGRMTFNRGSDGSDAAYIGYATSASAGDFVIQSTGGVGTLKFCVNSGDAALIGFDKSLTLYGALTGTAATFSTTAVGGQGGLVQIKAPSLAANNNVSLMVGKSIASQQSGFLAWYQGATDASSYLSLQTYSGASPLEIKSTNFNLSTGGNGTFSNSVFAPTISGTNTYGGKGLVKSAAIGFGAFFGTVDTGTLATTVGTIVDETSTQTYYNQKTGGNHSFYINGTQTASIDAGGINGVGNLSIANIGNGGIRLYGETVTGNGVVSLSPILKYGFSTVIANTGYVRFPVSIQGAIVVINGKAYGAPITSTKATVQSGVIYPKGSGTVTTIDCDERRMFIGNGTDWFEV